MLNVSKITDYLLVYLLIAFSGVPFFYRAQIAMMIAFLAFPAGVFYYRQRKLDRFFVYYILGALVVQFGQMLKLYELPLQTYVGLHIRLIFGYLTIKAVGKKTVNYYVDILVFSVFSSLIFYIPSYSNGFENFLKNSLAPLLENPLIKKSNYRVWPSVILYTINPRGEGILWLKRNSGPFWEPGAFSGFLIVALLFNIIQTGRLNNRKNKILIAGIISTFSTSGVMVVAFVILGYMTITRDVIKRFIWVPLLLVGAIVAFFSFDFLGAKVISKMQYTDKSYNTRFKSAQIDFEDFLRHPFLGLGRSEGTRFKGEQSARAIHRNNGVTNHLVMYGGIAFIIYFYLMYLTFYRLCESHQVDKRMAMIALITIWLIGFSQIYFVKVFFMTLTLMPVLYFKTNKTEDSKLE